MRTREQEVAAFTWLRTSKVAERLDCTTTQVIGLIDDGTLEAIDIGRGDKPNYRIHPDSVVAFEQNRKVKPKVKPSAA